MKRYDNAFQTTSAVFADNDAQWTFTLCKALALVFTLPGIDEVLYLTPKAYLFALADLLGYTVSKKG